MKHFDLVGSRVVRDCLEQYKDYKVFIRRGFAFRGAGEVEDDKSYKKAYINRQLVMSTFEERMNQLCDFYVAFDIDVDDDKRELHINAFSENDMY
jgi:hypothetical protein